jgi:hypothetical protein
MNGFRPAYKNRTPQIIEGIVPWENPRRFDIDTVLEFEIEPHKEHVWECEHPYKET